MTLLELMSIEETKNQLEVVVRPFQQELNRGQKKSDFVKKCMQCMEKNDFFQLDELLKSKQAGEVLEDENFEGCREIFSYLQSYANQQIEQYRVQFKDDLLQMAEKAGLPMELDSTRLSVLKGIEGEIDFAKRNTKINQTTLKSIDPRRIVSAALNIKKRLYDSPFEPQKFIDSLFECYKEILKKEKQKMGDVVPICELYTDYVFSLQSKTFFQNMDKGKFKGYSLEQFAVDIWRFFESKVSSAEGGYQIRLNSGRIKTLSLIDQGGEKRLISHAQFIKGEK